ncbi:MAG TPA: ATP-binding protein [Gaiellaceae bacterium]|nr:ATP-binding protein [Gaiellaceae bacterium]
MRELTAELRAVRDLARAAQGAFEVHELLDRICASVSDAFGFDRAVISRYLPETEEIERVAAYGVPLEAVRGLPLRIEDWPLVRQALERGEAVVAADVRSERAIPLEVAHEFGTGGLVTLPLMSQGRCLGFLSADRGGAPLDLDEAARAGLTTIGVLAASFLERALVHEEQLRVDRVKSNFIALASHELRAPAAVVYGISSTLHLRGDQLTEQQLAELRDALYEHSERFYRLVEQLLDLSRLEARSIQIRPERFVVRRTVEELVLAYAAERPGAVEVDVPAELEARADPEAFERIVGNLVANAVRYGQPPIRVVAEQRDRHFRLAIEDRGEGVPPEFAPHLFERFTRGHQTGEGLRGAGLGLSIAQSYAHAHGGKLIYQPATPKGARFELVLPNS